MRAKVKFVHKMTNIQQPEQVRDSKGKQIKNPIKVTERILKLGTADKPIVFLKPYTSDIGLLVATVACISRGEVYLHCYCRAKI